MDIGLHALGIGAGAIREVIDAVASTAEARAFTALWVGEHVIAVDTSSSRYPYSLYCSVALRAPNQSDVAALSDLGVDQFVVVASPPADPDQAMDWVDGLAARWLR